MGSGEERGGVEIINSSVQKAMDGEKPEGETVMIPSSRLVDAEIKKA